MTAPTPEQRAEWRASSERQAAGIGDGPKRILHDRILALLDALAAEGNAYAVNYADVVERWDADHRERMEIERELTARAERAEAVLARVEEMAQALREAADAFDPYAPEDDKAVAWVRTWLSERAEEILKDADD